jgi:hypothetical protein
MTIHNVYMEPISLSVQHSLAFGAKLTEIRAQNGRRNLEPVGSVTSNRHDCQSSVRQPMPTNSATPASLEVSLHNVVSDSLSINQSINQSIIKFNPA